MQSTPLVARDGRIVGMISAHWHRAHQPSDRDLARFEVLARQAADVVERSRAHDALRRSEQRLQCVLETEAVGVVFFDRSGTMLQANDVFLQMTGYSREQVAARALSWRKMTPPEWADITDDQMRCLENLGRIGPYEKEFLIADGSRRWMLVTGRDLGDGTFSKFCVDITDRKRAEAELQARNDDLERFGKVTVGRELRMIELKREINQLCRQRGEPDRYPLDLERSYDGEISLE